MALARAASSELKVSLEDLPGRIGGLLDERKKLERDLSDARKKLAMGGGAAASGGDDAETSATSSCWREKLAGIDIKDLRASPTKARSRSAPACRDPAASPTTARPAWWSASPPISDREQRRRSGAGGRRRALGGKGGGGRPDMAQAGGPDGAKADAAFAAIKKLVKTA